MIGKLRADLVLEGGGVKGIGHVGALSVLAERGYRFQRVAGTSVGALVAAFVAAGLSVERMETLMRPGADPHSIDYHKVVGSHPPLLGGVEDAISLLLAKGAHSSGYLADFIASTLRRETRGRVTTFGDLRLDDDRRDLAENQRYRLVVMVADVSRGSLVRLPWDLGVYGYTAADRDAMPIAEAVRASISIPFFFKPVRFPWKAPRGNLSYWVDGGAVSDFPIEIFDRTDGRPPRWPTFGIKLSARPGPGQLLNHVDGTLSFAEGLLETVVNGNDQVHLADPCVVARTIFVDASAVPATDFALSPEQQRLLFDKGREAAAAFLAAWDWEAYLQRCPAAPGHAARAQAARGQRPLPPT
jgi:NTE family protein